MFCGTPENLILRYNLVLSCTHTQPSPFDSVTLECLMSMAIAYCPHLLDLIYDSYTVVTRRESPKSDLLSLLKIHDRSLITLSSKKRKKTVGSIYD